MIQDRDDVLLRMFDPSVHQVGVDRHDDRFVIPFPDIVDEMTKRDAEKISDVSPTIGLPFVVGMRSSRIFAQKARVESVILPPTTWLGASP
jgi:hypothetical protein